MQRNAVRLCGCQRQTECADFARRCWPIVLLMSRESPNFQADSWQDTPRDIDGTGEGYIVQEDGQYRLCF
jgi:hypothetical protein